jgi:hypothetical protein
MNPIESKENALFHILTDMENLGCYKYQTTIEERQKIVKELIMRIDDGTIDQLSNKVTDWI